MNENEIITQLAELYAGKKYDAMHSLLEQSRDLQRSKSDFYYGVMYSGKGELGYSRYYFERAIKEGNSTPQLVLNLQKVKSHIVVHDISTSPYISDKFLNLFTGLSFEFYLSCCLLLTIFFLSRITKKPALWLKTLGVMFLSWGVVVLFAWWLNSFSVAIAVKKAPIKNGPADIFSSQKNLESGGKVIVGEKSGKYYFIESPKEYAGWVSQDNVKLL